MGKGMQNSSAGVRLAARHRADFVELDIVKGMDGRFLCGHGLGERSALGDCLAEIGDSMELIAHLKGRYEEADLMLLVEEIARYLPLTRVMFASHDGGVLGRLRELVPDCWLGRFGLVPAIMALWREPPWDCCMINQLVLLKWHVLALQRRGQLVFASCVWELRDRRSVKNLEVDGAFVNFYQ